MHKYEEKNKNTIDSTTLNYRWHHRRLAVIGSNGN